ncbi:hypothetical protein JCM3765_006818 [Sporobolomyces pararoseus]
MNLGGGGEAEDVATERGKRKEKFRQFFKLDSNKVSAPGSPSNTPLPVETDFSRPALPSLDRVRSRGRSNSAPSLFNSPQMPVQAFEWNPAFSAFAIPTEHSSRSTPFHSAVSSPLSVYFPFSPELECSASAEDELIDTFRHYLPLELQIRVMQALLEVCEEDWQSEVEEGTWRGAKARERWSEGEARGRRELARIAKVSKSWRRLSLDAQLWANGPATSSIGADAQSLQSVVSLFQESGPSIKKLELQGYGKSLNWSILEQIVTAASVNGLTNLTSINLRGCNSLSSRSITNLLSPSPQLTFVDLYALPQVVPSHIELLASQCRRLKSLNISRCRNLPASSLLVLTDTAISPSRSLTSLSVSALSGMSNEVVFAIWTKQPKLESIDISFSPQLTDEVFKRITTSSDSVDRAVQPESQRPYSSSTSSFDPKTRSFPYLKSLNLTGCTSLTSLSLSYFVLPRTSSFASATLGSLVPSLLQLQLSRLSPSFDTSNHLSSFLESVRPTLVKLDLEDGINLTDQVLQSLETSEKLETLILNSCSRFTDQAILGIIRRCKILKVLEVDGTEVSDATAKEFVLIVKERKAQKLKEGKVEEETGSAVKEKRYAVEIPTVLSILDNRLTGRRLHREIGNSLIRPRIGYRGHWTGAAVGFYHDGNEEGDEGAEGSKGVLKNRLEECEGDKTVVRSFYSSLEVDAANAVRRAREEKKERGAKGGMLRIRAMSDSILLANGGRGGGGGDGGYEGAEGTLSTVTGCTVM